MNNMTKRQKMAIWATVLYLSIMTTGMLILKNVYHINYGAPKMMEVLIYFVFFAVLTSVIIYFKDFRGTAFKKVKWNWWLLEFGLFTVAVLAAQVFLGNYKNADMTLIWTVVATTVIVGIGEEMLFRGLIYTAYKEKHGVFVGILVSSFVFGFLHITNLAGGAELGATLFQMLNAGLSGVVSAWVFYKTENLVPTIIYHGIWDMMGLVGTIVTVDVATYLSLVQTVFETASGIVILVYAIINLRKGYKNPEDRPKKA